MTTADDEGLQRLQDRMAMRRGFESYDIADYVVRASIDRALTKQMRTADGQPLTDGMRVWTNDLEAGTVDLSQLDFEWHNNETRWVPWFDVIVESRKRGVSQSDDRVAVRHPFSGNIA